MLENEGRADGTAQDEGQGEQVYRTQREIDVVIGHRLRRERDKWDKEHRDALLLERALGEQGLREALTVYLARAEGPGDAEAARQPEEEAEGDAEVEIGAEPDEAAAAEAEGLEALIEAAREEGRIQAVAAMHRRAGRPPMYGGGAAGADFFAMPDAALRAIDQRLKRGERVRI